MTSVHAVTTAATARAQALGKARKGVRGARANQAPLVASPAAPAPTHVPLPTIPPHPLRYTPVGGEWKVDWERARRDAQAALDAIDWSKKDIVLWVPGTDNHVIHAGFHQAVRDAWGAAASVSTVDYMSNWNMRTSAPTGIETLRLVLAGIAAQGGDRRVFIGAESQGAWVTGEAIADPMLKHVVDRAVLFGHPSVAAHHYDNDEDPRVIEITHPMDQVAAKLRPGTETTSMDAMVALRNFSLGKVPLIAKGALANPGPAALAILAVARLAVPFGTFFIPDFHNYDKDMVRGVAFLRTGVREGGQSTGDHAGTSDASLPLRRRKLVAALNAA